jgi:NAD(P)-dependent dehydrogenase (short-subunit alcohol dehydrogenase family)
MPSPTKSFSTSGDGIPHDAFAMCYIKTERIAKASWGMPSPEVEKLFVGALPLRRAGKPEDIAGVVAMLCSEAGAYVSGATLDVNGGWHFGP